MDILELVLEQAKETALDSNATVKECTKALDALATNWDQFDKMQLNKARYLYSQLCDLKQWTTDNEQADYES